MSSILYSLYFPHLHNSHIRLQAKKNKKKQLDQRKYNKKRKFVLEKGKNCRVAYLKKESMYLLFIPKNGGCEKNDV